MMARKSQKGRWVIIIVGKYTGIIARIVGGWKESRYWYLVDFMWKGRKGAAILASHEFEVMFK